MDPDRLAALRRRYDRPPLLPSALGPDPFTAFEGWLAEAVASADEGLVSEANAMVLATADASGVPSARTVLLKAYDARGFVFHTNYTSAKAHALDANPRASLLFPWHGIDRQVRVDGTVARIDADESAAYFRSRPWASRIGAWASRQSSVLPDRASLDDRFAALAERWPEGTDVPVPDFWGGYRVAPLRIEFWQGRPDRLHDRIRYARTEAVRGAGADADADAGWTIERLAP